MARPSLTLELGKITTGAMSLRADGGERNPCTRAHDALLHSEWCEGSSSSGASHTTSPIMTSRGSSSRALSARAYRPSHVDITNQNMPIHSKDEKIRALAAAEISHLTTSAEVERLPRDLTNFLSVVSIAASIPEDSNEGFMTARDCRGLMDGSTEFVQETGAPKVEKVQETCQIAHEISTDRDATELKRSCDPCLRRAYTLDDEVNWRILDSPYLTTASLPTTEATLAALNQCGDSVEVQVDHGLTAPTTEAVQAELILQEQCSDNLSEPDAVVMTKKSRRTRIKHLVTNGSKTIERYTRNHHLTLHRRKTEALSSLGYRTSSGDYDLPSGRDAESSDPENIYAAGFVKDYPHASSDSQPSERTIHYSQAPRWRWPRLNFCSNKSSVMLRRNQKSCVLRAEHGAIPTASLS